MRSVVLGGAGFIGAHLARRLLAEGRQVTVVDDFSRGVRDGAVAMLESAGARVISADLTRAEDWAGLGQDWDEVYHLAAVVGVRNVERDPLRCMRVNTLSTLHLVDWLPPRARVFYSSTSEVYADGVDLGLVSVPTDETALVAVGRPTAPRSAYAVSKLWGEALLAHAGSARGLAWVTGRFHNVYGPRMGMDHVVPEMLARAAGGESPFRVWGTDQTRAFCFVDDAVEAVVRLMETPGAAGRTVHIGTAVETPILDLAALVLDIVGVAQPIQPLPAPAGSVTRRCPDISLLRSLTGYEPAVDLAGGVRRTWCWYAAAEAADEERPLVTVSDSVSRTAPLPEGT